MTQYTIFKTLQDTRMSSKFSYTRPHDYLNLFPHKIFKFFKVALECLSNSFFFLLLFFLFFFSHLLKETPERRVERNMQLSLLCSRSPVGPYSWNGCKTTWCYWYWYWFIHVHMIYSGHRKGPWDIERVKNLCIYYKL